MGRQEVKEQMMRRIVRLVNSGARMATDGKGGVTGVNAASMPGAGPASMFSREEEAYLVWGEDTLRAFKAELDEQALAEIGLTETEIAGLRGLWRVYERAGTPSGACGDGLRYVLAGLDWLPRQDKCKGHVTEASFLQSVSCRAGKNEKTDRTEYSLVLRRVLREAEAAGWGDLWLCGAFRKIVRWCDCFASIHGLVDTSLGVGDVPGTETGGRIGERIEKRPCEAGIEENATSGDDGRAESPDNHGKVTEKQKRFLAELVSRRYGESTAMAFDFTGLSKEDASRQIETLREMRDERVEVIDSIDTGRRDTGTWSKREVGLIACMY